MPLRSPTSYPSPARDPPSKDPSARTPVRVARAPTTRQWPIIMRASARASSISSGYILLEHSLGTCYRRVFSRMYKDGAPLEGELRADVQGSGEALCQATCPRNSMVYRGRGRGVALPLFRG